MSTFNAVAEQFVKKWTWETEPIAETETHFLSIEKAFSVQLPLNYKFFVSKYGCPSTKWLLHSIVEGGYEMPDIQEFIHIAKIVEDTQMYESGGMDQGYISFASDCMGNMFLFKNSECKEDKNDTHIYFFDHDFCEISLVNDSFEDLLAQYLDVEYVEG